MIHPADKASNLFQRIFLVTISLALLGAAFSGVHAGEARYGGHYWGNLEPHRAKHVPRILSLGLFPSLDEADVPDPELVLICEILARKDKEGVKKVKAQWWSWYYQLFPNDTWEQTSQPLKGKVKTKSDGYGRWTRKVPERYLTAGNFNKNQSGVWFVRVDFTNARQVNEVEIFCWTDWRTRDRG